jgi:hypothetical protein
VRQKVLDRFGVEVEPSFDEETQTNMRVRIEWRRLDHVVTVRFAEKLPAAN